MENRQVRWMKIVLLVSSLATVALLAVVAYHENFRGEWRAAQRLYREWLVKTGRDENGRRAAAAFEVSHRQLYLEELDRVDRCVICHLGVENPNMTDAPQPLKAHPEDLLGYHPADRFGCTICHEGSGRNVVKEAAHGWHDDGSMVAHAETPLLRGKTVYTSCGKCHYEIDLFGALGDLHASEADRASGQRAKLPIDVSTLTLSLPGAEAVARGKRLLVESGCLGCHKYRGRGGVLGPDISYVGDKTKHDFDFTHVKGEHTVEQWLYEHFKLPAEVSPDTLMPDMKLTDDEARQLTSYMMSLHRKSAPASHRPPPRFAFQHAAEPAGGEVLYKVFCSSCHGDDGFGTTLRTGLWPTDADPWGHHWDARNVMVEKRDQIDVVVPSLNHNDTLAVASPEYLRHVIAEGRPGTKMLAWAGEGGLTDDEITRLVDHVLRWRLRPPDVGEIASSRGNARFGAALYRANCASCHGTNGEGGVGNSLNSPTFLAVASDAFLRDTIIHGRPNTAMPAWRRFSSQEISDLLAHLRQWQRARSDVGEALKKVSEESPDVSLAVGRTLYKANCVMCHGRAGEGDLGPSLNTQEFLAVATDEYLLTTLVEGRPGTAMPSWHHRSSEDLASIVRFLRTWQKEPGRSAEWHAAPVARGDADAGCFLFAKICAGCHGPDGEGATAPQLSNPVFLRTASDRMLEEWITFGKSGTEMRSFRKGGQGIAELSRRQISDLVAYLRSLEREREDGLVRVAKSPHGRPEKGAVHYAQSCAGCHGERGEGASGPALSNPNFLRFASDGFLMATMALGRRGTEMRPVKRGPQSILGLTSDEVNDLVAFLRSWEHNPPFGTEVGEAIPHRFVVPWDLAAGRQVYLSNCAGCHGVEGKGSWAPELNNEGFLRAATDGFLQATVIRGRRGTAMRPFGKGGHGITELSGDDIDNLVAYMRSWSRETPSPMTIPAERSLQSVDAVNESEDLRSAMLEPLNTKMREKSTVATAVRDPKETKQ